MEDLKQKKLQIERELRNKRKERELKDKDGFRPILEQMVIKINRLHVRYEDDYFSNDRPYSIGLVANSVTIDKAEPGREIWQFS